MIKNNWLWNIYAYLYNTLSNLIAYRNLIDTFVNLIKELDIEIGFNVLDVGCGTGTLSATIANKFPKAKLTSVDNSNNMLKVAKKKNRHESIDYQLIDISDIKTIQQKYVLAVMNNVLYIQKNKEKVLKELVEKVESKGYLIISDPVPPEEYSYWEILKPQFGSFRGIITLLFLIPSLIFILLINLLIDKKYDRLDNNEYITLFKGMNLNILYNGRSYANQANIYLLQKN